MATERAAVAMVESLGLVDTGLYKASWEARETADGAEVTNGAPYAGVIEEGARPFTPPLDPILAWAERKAGDLGIAPAPFRGRSSLTDPQRQAARQIARAIQRKFARDGIAPKYPMKSQLPFAKKALQRALEEYLEDIARGKS